MEVDRAGLRVHEHVGRHLLRRVGQRGVHARDVVGIPGDLVHERLTARQQQDREEPAPGRTVELHVLLVRRVRVGEVRHQEVALLEVLRTAELLPEPLGNLRGELHELALAGEVALELGGKAGVRRKRSVAALRVGGDLAQVALDKGARGADREVERALREVGGAGVEVKDVQDRAVYLEHVGPLLRVVLEVPHDTAPARD